MTNRTRIYFFGMFGMFCLGATSQFYLQMIDGSYAIFGGLAAMVGVFVVACVGIACGFQKMAAKTP